MALLQRARGWPHHQVFLADDFSGLSGNTDVHSTTDKVGTWGVSLVLGCPWSWDHWLTGEEKGEGSACNNSRSEGGRICVSKGPRPCLKGSLKWVLSPLRLVNSLFPVCKKKKERKASSGPSVGYRVGSRCKSTEVVVQLSTIDGISGNGGRCGRANRGLRMGCFFAFY